MLWWNFNVFNCDALFLLLESGNISISDLLAIANFQVLTGSLIVNQQFNFLSVAFLGLRNYFLFETLDVLVALSIFIQNEIAIHYLLLVGNLHFAEFLIEFWSSLNFIQNTVNFTIEIFSKVIWRILVSARIVLISVLLSKILPWYVLIPFFILFSPVTAIPLSVCSIVDSHTTLGLFFLVIHLT